MKKILIINTVGFDFEGISSVIVNYISHMDRSGLVFDFIAQPNIREDFKKLLTPLGNVSIIPDRKEDTCGYILGLNKVMSKKEYDAIHIHGNSGTMAIESFFAKLHHVNRIIVHVHTTKCDHPLINHMLKPIMKIFSTDLLACSNKAGKWLYGNRKFSVLNNAIDTERFRFNQQVRDECRKEFGLKDEFVIGHIGYFLDLKNHDFLIAVFNEYHKMNADSRLLLVSDGPKLREIQNKVQQYGIEESVIFAGRRKDVEKLYCAMDVFVFPSIHEGLPLTLIEAQASGLPCIASDSITNEVGLTPVLQFLSLEHGLLAWRNAIIKVRNDLKDVDRIDMAQQCRDMLCNAGYDISQNARILKELYLKE